MFLLCARVDSLRLEPRDRIELLDRRGAEAGQGTEDRPLDLGDLSVLHRIHERVLRLRCMVLQLLRRVLLASSHDKDSGNVDRFARCESG